MQSKLVLTSRQIEECESIRSDGKCTSAVAIRLSKRLQLKSHEYIRADCFLTHTRPTKQSMNRQM